MAPPVSSKSKHTSSAEPAKMLPHHEKKSGTQTRDEFLDEVRQLLGEPIKISNLHSLSDKLVQEFQKKLEYSHICMLPSFIHTLPSGHEKGSYLALDVGGTNFRIALVDLLGREVEGQLSSMKIVKMCSFRIDNRVRALKGHDFFDWMAEKIGEVIHNPEVRESHGADTYVMGVSWSFPVEQTSIRTGALLSMGKGFSASNGVAGQDLTGLVMAACKRKNLDVRMDAVINDGSATLLSRAYTDSTTRFGLILGTGTNASVILPVAALSSSKFDDRPQDWLDFAKEVLVNTEFSMFGKDILPMTRWDHIINDTHKMPDYQPYEHMLGGRYLGEIVRLIMVEAVWDIGLFKGQTPEGLDEPYTLDTAILAIIEEDDKTTFNKGIPALTDEHPLQYRPSVADMQLLRTIIQLVTHRAAALLATAIHALWTLRASSYGESFAETKPVSLGCNGSVIERYPCFRSLTQHYVDQLTTMSGAKAGAVVLEVAVESAIYGAAVAVACLEGLEG